MGIGQRPESLLVPRLGALQRGVVHQRILPRSVASSCMEIQRHRSRPKLIAQFEQPPESLPA
jgi:hypothetical protein